MSEGRSPVRGRLEVNPRKSGRVWVALVVQADGTPTRRVLGPAWVRDSGKKTPRGAIIWRAASGSKPTDEHLTPRDADEMLQRLLDEERKKSPTKARRARGKTWGDATDALIKHDEKVRGLADTTIGSYKSVLHCLEREGLPRSTPLRAVTADKLERVQLALLDRVDPKLPKKAPADDPDAPTRLARQTVATRVIMIGSVCSFAVSKKWMPSNPLDDIEVVTPPPPSEDFHHLEPSQIESVARAIETIRDDEIPRMRNGKVDKHALDLMRRARAMWAQIVRVAAYTGLRFGELRAWRWRDIDFAGATVRVVENLPGSAPAGAKPRRPKGKKGRSLPFIDQAAVAIDNVSRMGLPNGPNDLVFPNVRGGMQDAGRVRDAFYAGLYAVGLGHLREVDEPIVFHDLRHTFGTLAVRVFPLVDVQAYFGHKDISTTMRYVHHVPRTDAARRLSEAFAADLNPTTAATAASRAPQPA